MAAVGAHMPLAQWTGHDDALNVHEPSAHCTSFGQAVTDAAQSPPVHRTGMSNGQAMTLEHCEIDVAQVTPDATRGHTTCHE